MPIILQLTGCMWRSHLDTQHDLVEPCAEGIEGPILRQSESWSVLAFSEAICRTYTHACPWFKSAFAQQKDLQLAYLHCVNNDSACTMCLL